MDGNLLEVDIADQKLNSSLHAFGVDTDGIDADNSSDGSSNSSDCFSEGTETTNASWDIPRHSFPEGTHSNENAISNEDQEKALQSLLFLENSVKIRAILSKQQCVDYQYRIYASHLEGPKTYFYTDYVELLGSLWPHLSISEDLLKDCVYSSQILVRQSFVEMQKCAPQIEDLQSREKKLFTSLPSQTVDQSLVEDIRWLEFLLHRLTEEKILKAIEELLEYTYSDNDSIYSIASAVSEDSETLQRFLSRIFESIQAWREFIHQVDAIYSKQNDPAQSKAIDERKQYLLQWHRDTEKKCYRNIIQSTRQWVEDLAQNYESLRNGKDERPNVQYYEKASKAVKCLSLPLFKDSLLKQEQALHLRLNTKLMTEFYEIPRDFNQYKGYFETYCLKFFPSKVKELLQDFEASYEHNQNTANPAFDENYQLFERYRDLKNTLLTWDDFLELYDPLHIKTAEGAYSTYKKWENSAEEGKVASKDFLEFLFSLFASVPQREDLFFLAYDSIKKQLAILNAIKQLLNGHRNAAKEVIDLESSEEIRQKMEADLYAHCLEGIREMKGLVRVLQEKKHHPTSLIKRLGVGNYQRTFLEYCQATRILSNHSAVEELCRAYFGELWPPDDEYHQNAESALQPYRCI